MLKVVYAGTGKRACEVLSWMREQADIVAVIHQIPKDAEQLPQYQAERRFVKSVCETVIDTNPNEPAAREILSRATPDLLVNFACGYVYKPAVLRIPSRGAINVHPSLLPLHRGSGAAPWTLIEGTPAGVTIHKIDEGIDTGEIIAQREVPYEPDETLSGLITRLFRARFDLLRETWPVLCNGYASRPQNGPSCYHEIADYWRKFNELASSKNPSDRALGMRLDS